MMGNKIAFGLLFGIVAMVAVSAASAQNEVYLVPQHSNAPFCNTVEVLIWANTTDTFVAGQINLTYSHCCANVTNLEYDSLWQGTWDSRIDGREWLVFMRPLGQPTINGTVLIGNLTIHCCNESKCVTSLTFSLPSKLSDPIAGDLTVNWTGGTFTCLPPTLFPTPMLTPTAATPTPMIAPTEATPTPTQLPPNATQAPAEATPPPAKTDAAPMPGSEAVIVMIVAYLLRRKK